MLSVTKEALAEAFNTWLGDYIENPGKFVTIQDEVAQAVKEAMGGEEPSYGANCAALLVRYMEMEDDDE